MAYARFYISKLFPRKYAPVPHRNARGDIFSDILDIQLYQHQWKLEKLEIKRRFSNFSFFQSPLVLIQLYMKKKNVLYFLNVK